MRRPHILGVDEGSFDKQRDRSVPLIGVVMAGPELVEGVLVGELEIDAGGITGELARWIAGSRFHAAIRAVLFEGITFAGLSVIDLPELSRRIERPVISVIRREPRPGELERALRAASFPERISLIEKAGPCHICDKVFFHCAGVRPEAAAELLRASTGRSDLPEAVRLCHLIGQALRFGESRGRA